MTEQLDWIGGTSLATKPFKDIRNQRPTVAEQKAQLCLDLKKLISRVPDRVRGGVHPDRAPLDRRDRGRQEGSRQLARQHSRPVAPGARHGRLGEA
jgi:hypothetical protein